MNNNLNICYYIYIFHHDTNSTFSQWFSGKVLKMHRGRIWIVVLANKTRWRTSGVTMVCFILTRLQTDSLDLRLLPLCTKESSVPRMISPKYSLHKVTDCLPMSDQSRCETSNKNTSPKKDITLKMSWIIVKINCILTNLSGVTFLKF